MKQLNRKEVIAQLNALGVEFSTKSGTNRLQAKLEKALAEKAEKAKQEAKRQAEEKAPAGEWAVLLFLAKHKIPRKTICTLGGGISLAHVNNLVSEYKRAKKAGRQPEKSPSPELNQQLLEGLKLYRDSMTQFLRVAKV